MELGGVFVSLFIFYSGISSAREAIDPLLGAKPEPEFVDRLKEMVLDFDKNILGMHDLMVHDYGPGHRIVSFHAEVPEDGDMVELHDIIDKSRAQDTKGAGVYSDHPHGPGSDRG